MKYLLHKMFANISSNVMRKKNTEIILELILDQ